LAVVIAVLAGGVSLAAALRGDGPSVKQAAHNDGGAEPSAGLSDHSTHHAPGDLRKVGAVNFPNSCDPAVQAEFKRGVALLHSFFYDEARKSFEAVTKQDTKCAIGHWGTAMTWYHPVWAAPTDDEFQAGLAAVETARAAEPPTPREQGYIAALATFFCAPGTGADSARESCPAAHAERAGRYREAMAALHRDHPEDDEAAVFYALALLGSAPATDPTFANQVKAGEILGEVWRRDPDHPGVVHYLIHAFDYPSLADHGLAAARAYADIAPWVPHALHMPSHTFTRLGLWEDSIETNLDSAEAARAHMAEHHPGKASFEELHALYYVVYALLQTARDDEAKDIVDRVAAMDQTHPDSDFVVAYAMGAIPARFALERGAWAEAASLPVPPRRLWADFPFAEAHLEFAHALGRARTGDVSGTRLAIDRLQQLRDAVTGARFEYFRKHIDVQIEAASGWLDLAERRHDEALASLRRAADAEDLLGKHPVSPGSIVPVRELLGHALIEARRPVEALEAYEASLRLNRGRFVAVSGAALAAEQAGHRDVAERYYRQLLDLSRAGGQRPELTHARAYLDKQ
ncbi:MAG TPA: hypothetical protein VG795_09775, partial [Acidimicrobiia bacterium]|nr:hypothetical protein [Acidimicrobiia bacterium]